MLIQFTVGNYLSFKDKVTLSMEATSITEHTENVFTTPDGRYKLLKSVAIYGANGSGKSNLINAMKKMGFMLRSSFQNSSIANLGIDPFRLSTETDSKPSFFEITILLDSVKYRYGYEVDDNSIQSEWLFECQKNKEKPLFVRDHNVINVFPSFKEGKQLEEKTGTNKLFLTVVDQFNGMIAKKIIQWVTQRNVVFSALDLELGNYKEGNRKLLLNPNYKKVVFNFYKNLGLGINDFNVITNKDKLEKVDTSMRDILRNKDLFVNIKTSHLKYDHKHYPVDKVIFDLHQNESKGTNKIFDCSGVIFSSLELGSTLSLDELDASLHPLITLAVTKLFNSSINNAKNAQLIFTTHDTNLLSKGGFRRDQIYFVEKDNYEASHLYSLAEFKEPDGKKVRKDRSFEEDYIQGRYGAIPFIGDFSKLLSDGK